MPPPYLSKKSEGHDSAHSPDTGDRTVSRTAHNHPLPNPFSHDIHLSAGDVFLRIRPARLHVLQRGGNGTVSGNTQHQGRLQDRLQTVLQHPDRHPEHRPDGPEKHSLRPLVRHDRILQFGKPERFGATGRRNDLLRSPDLRRGARLRETVPDSDDDAFAPHHRLWRKRRNHLLHPGPTHRNTLRQKLLRTMRSEGRS